MLAKATFVHFLAACSMVICVSSIVLADLRQGKITLYDGGQSFYALAAVRL